MIFDTSVRDMILNQIHKIHNLVCKNNKKKNWFFFRTRSHQRPLPQPKPIKPQIKQKLESYQRRRGGPGKETTAAWGEEDWRWTARPAICDPPPSPSPTLPLPPLRWPPPPPPAPPSPHLRRESGQQTVVGRLIGHSDIRISYPDSPFNDIVHLIFLKNIWIEYKLKFLF